MDLPEKTIGIRLPGEDSSGRKKKRKRARRKALRRKRRTPKKPITLDDDKIFEATAADHRRKGKVNQPTFARREHGRRGLSGGRPGPRGESHFRRTWHGLSKPSKFVEAGTQRFQIQEERRENPKSPAKPKLRTLPKESSGH